MRFINEKKKWEKLYFLKDVNYYTLYITIIAGRGKKRTCKCTFYVEI